jgi:hypothetical protein
VVVEGGREGGAAARPELGLSVQAAGGGGGRGRQLSQQPKKNQSVGRPSTTRIFAKAAKNSNYHVNMIINIFMCMLLRICILTL